MEDAGLSVKWINYSLFADGGTTCQQAFSDNLSNHGSFLVPPSVSQKTQATIR